jgi:hypothetical protein
MKTSGEWGVVSLTLRPLCFGVRAPSTHWITDSVRPTAGLDDPSVVQAEALTPAEIPRYNY